MPGGSGMEAAAAVLPAGIPIITLGGAIPAARYPILAQEFFVALRYGPLPTPLMAVSPSRSV